MPWIARLEDQRSIDCAPTMSLGTAARSQQRVTVVARPVARPVGLPMLTAPRRSPVASRPAPKPRSGEERQRRGRGVDLVSMTQDVTLRGQGFSAIRARSEVPRQPNARRIHPEHRERAPGQDERRAGQLRERITPRWEHSVSADKRQGRSRCRSAHGATAGRHVRVPATGGRPPERSPCPTHRGRCIYGR
jgi:hypothetical protein